VKARRAISIEVVTRCTAVSVLIRDDILTFVKTQTGVVEMKHRGFSHIGLSTLDLDKTRAFYEGVLGFKPVVADTITIEEGGPCGTCFSMSAAVS